MKAQTFRDMVFKQFPHAELDVTDDGQIIIYTGLKYDPDNQDEYGDFDRDDYYPEEVEA